MNEPVEIFLGFDPGGMGRKKGEFGWSICHCEADEFKQFRSGVGKCAGEVVETVGQVLSNCLSSPRILAVGIDAPMFWNMTGEDRAVDKVIRGAVKNKSVKSSVIPVNSLQGACLVQGILVGDACYKQFKQFNAPITEAHPKVLRYLLKQSPDGKSFLTVPSKRKNEKPHEWDARTAKWAARKKLHSGKRFPAVLCKCKKETLHEWDARTAAYAAWRMHQQAPGWRDLVKREFDKEEPEYVIPLLPNEATVSYWMPIP